MSYPTDAYDITTISFKKRIINSILIGMPLIALGLAACFMAYKDGEYTGILGGLLFFIAGCFLTHRIYKAKEKKELKGTWEVTYEKNRIKNTLAALGMLGSILAVYVFAAKMNMLNDGGLTFLIFVVVAILYLVPLWSPKRKFVLTGAALVEKQRLETLATEKSLENAKKWEEIEKRWWFRYPLAILIVVASIWVSEIKPNLWWLGVIGAIYAAILAREASLLILGVGAIYLVFKGIASLPVGVAIIVGALIIASAVKR
jgi:hypothetical protein